jgi:hypothetical protein
MDLSRYVVLDCTSGTFFNAAHAMLIDVDALPEGLEESMLNEGSDTDRCELADIHGIDLEAWSPASPIPLPEEVREVAEALRGPIMEPWAGLHGANVLARAAELLTQPSVAATPPDDKNAQVLDAVAELLNNEQWSSDHLEAVADMVRATGRAIGDNFHSDAPSQSSPL